MCVPFVTAIFASMWVTTGAAAADTSVASTSSRWTEVTSPHFGTLMALDAVTAHDMWTVGTYYDQPQGRELPLTEHWDGVRFTMVQAPPGSDGYNGFQGVAAISHDDVWAVGYKTPVYYTYVRSPLIEHWNGRRWAIVKGPFQGEGELTGVAALSAHDIWAVGFRSANPYGSLVLHWDGSTWSIVEDGHATDNTWLRGVVATSSNDVWAGGATQAGDKIIAFAEHWDGTSWTEHLAQPGAEYDEFNAIARDPANGDLWGVGWQTPDIGYFQMAQRWDGSTWAMRAPPQWPYNNNLYGVVVARGRAWAVGYGSESGPRTLVERWDDSGWHVERLPVSGGQRLLAIARAGSSLWAVGENLILQRPL
jgi:hypothetical protein